MFNWAYTYSQETYHDQMNMKYFIMFVHSKMGTLLAFNVKVSPGCLRCYLGSLSYRRLHYDTVMQHHMTNELWKVEFELQSMVDVPTSLEWVLFMCLAQSEALENAFPHPSYLHRYGRSPVWERRCVLRFSSLE